MNYNYSHNEFNEKLKLLFLIGQKNIFYILVYF